MYGAPDRSLPKFDKFALREKRSQYCVIVFVLNEGERIRTQLAMMAQLADRIDVVVADGGSTDGALDLESLRAWNVRTLLVKREAGGLSAQMRMAFGWALGERYEGVITIDGNGKDDPSAIPDFESLLRRGVDHIQGSRFIEGGHAINTPPTRWLGVQLLHAPLISLAARRRHTDTTNGFRGYSARLLADERLAIFRPIFQTYELHYHLSIESSRDGRFVTAETPVTRTYPAHGRPPTKISPLKGNLRIVWLLVRAVSGSYRFHG